MPPAEGFRPPAAEYAHPSARRRRGVMIGVGVAGAIIVVALLVWHRS